jgi:hypothetical protein
MRIGPTPQSAAKTEPKTTGPKQLNTEHEQGRSPRGGLPFLFLPSLLAAAAIAGPDGTILPLERNRRVPRYRPRLSNPCQLYLKDLVSCPSLLPGLRIRPVEIFFVKTTGFSGHSTSSTVECREASSYVTNITVTLGRSVISSPSRFR